MTTLALFLGTVGCAGSGDDLAEAEGWIEMLPDERVLVQMPNDIGAERSGDYSPYYLLTASVTQDVNGMIGGVLATVDAATQLPPTLSDEEASMAIWGPFTDPLNPAEWMLYVTYDGAADVYTWGVSGRASGTEDAWTPVVAGRVEAGATAEASRGSFAFDFDAAAELDPTEVTAGLFWTEYDVGLDGVVATAAFDGFRDEGGDEIDAAYHYEQVESGDGLMDLAFLHDLNPDSGTATDELHIVRSRWTAAGEGRADAYATEGDLGDQVVTAVECWDTAYQLVYYADSWGPSESGDAAACAFDAPEYNETEES